MDPHLYQLDIVYLYLDEHMHHILLCLVTNTAELIAIKFGVVGKKRTEHRDGPL